LVLISKRSLRPRSYPPRTCPPGNVFKQDKSRIGLPESYRDRRSQLGTTVRRPYWCGRTTNDGGHVKGSSRTHGGCRWVVGGHRSPFRPSRAVTVGAEGIPSMATAHQAERQSRTYFRSLSKREGVGIRKDSAVQSGDGGEEGWGGVGRHWQDGALTVSASPAVRQRLGVHATGGHTLAESSDPADPNRMPGGSPSS
jgi:hypothetical protein